MGYPLKEDFKGNQPVSMITADWLNTVARILNYIRFINCEVQKTGTGDSTDPWIVNAPAGGSGSGLPAGGVAGDVLQKDTENQPAWAAPTSAEELPAHAAGTVNQVLRSTGVGAPEWSDLLALIVALTGANSGDMFYVNNSGALVKLDGPSGAGSDYYAVCWDGSRPTWVKLSTSGVGLPSTSGKSQYMVLQLTGSPLAPTWDWLRAH